VADPLATVYIKKPSLYAGKAFFMSVVFLDELRIKLNISNEANAILPTLSENLSNKKAPPGKEGLVVF